MFICQAIHKHVVSILQQLLTLAMYFFGGLHAYISVTGRLVHVTSQQT